MSGIARDNPIAAADTSWAGVGQLVSDVALGHPSSLRWWAALAAALALMGVLAVCVLYLLIEGVGVWGNNIPVTWALDIVSYDWWIGVACGGLTISAVLLLLDAEWRGAVNRLTETMAVIAACAAGLYPIIHLGRPWFFYWNLPYPNTFLLWPQFRSPLYWDAVDIISFLLVCVSFWYVGLLPDLGCMRDRALERAERMAGRPGAGMRLMKAQMYGIAAIGWRGSATHWQRWEQAYRAIAAFGIIVVISLQAAAAVMFAGSLEPGWHDTMMPITFLCSALFSGAAVATLLLMVVRAVFPLRPLMAPRHVELLAWLLLGLGTASLYCESVQACFTLLMGSPYARQVQARQFGGAHAWSTWALILCALLPVHLFWIPRLRRTPVVLGAVGLLAAFGLWADHFMVIVTTLQQDFLPSSAHPYTMDAVAVGTFIGTIGLFLFLLLLFLRYVPMVSIVGLRRGLHDLPLRGR
jgi:Ni/Fe-hydrogenase subunit HybB-like protein